MKTLRRSHATRGMYDLYHGNTLYYTESYNYEKKGGNGIREEH